MYNDVKVKDDGEENKKDGEKKDNGVESKKDNDVEVKRIMM